MKGRRDRPGPRASAPAESQASLPLAHPAWIVTALVAAVCVLVSVTFRIYETDFWQHLAVGRAIWTLHAVPTTQIWTWPTYGAPDVNSSWGFEALLWPIWRSGGTLGLFLWRWATTLAVFGLAFATSRRMGARGFTPLVVMVVCALTYRQRSQVRPETLASVWLALSLWLLEIRPSRATKTAPARGGTPTGWNPALGLVPLLWLWGNTHLSFPLGFVVLAAHGLAALRARS